MLLVAPVPSGSDVVDRRMAHAESLGYRRLLHHSKKRPDQSDILGSEFGSIRSPHVLGVRDGLQVIGIHATTITAQVVKFKSVGDGAESLLIKEHVRSLGNAISGDPVRVSNVIKVRPDPATRIRVNDVPLFGSDAGIMALNIPHRNALDAVPTAIRASGNCRPLTATTLTQSKGDGMVLLHLDLLTSGAAPGVLAHRPALSILPRIPVTTPILEV